MRKFINMNKYEPLDEYFISQNPNHAKQLRKIMEENAKKFKPEPNTISWWAEKLPESAFHKNHACYTSSGVPSDAFIKKGVLLEVEEFKELSKEAVKYGKSRD